MFDGVLQQSRLLGDTDNQLPPLEDFAYGVNPIALPVLSIATVCGEGFVPCLVVKVTAGTSTKTGLPTVTATGMVTRPVVVLSTSCPRNVPASLPAPGKLLAVTDTEYVPSFVPLVGVTLSHLPASPVLTETVQASVPDPRFPIGMVCAGGFPPLGINEKL